MLGLNWRRVDLRQGLIYLEAEHTKGQRRRTIPLNAEARAAMISRANWHSEHCPGSPWVLAQKDGRRVQSLKRSFSSACEDAGITDFRSYDLRHACAAWLVTGGVPLPEVRDLLDHSTITLTEGYAHLAPAGSPKSGPANGAGFEPATAPLGGPRSESQGRKISNLARPAPRFRDAT